MAGGLPYGLQAMLKEGHKHYSGLEEAVYKNIEAGKQLSQIARTSMGPNGQSAFNDTNNLTDLTRRLLENCSSSLNSADGSLWCRALQA